MVWHRRIGLLACGALLLWSVSGAMHPLMSRYQPQPVARMAPAISPPATNTPALSGILARAGLDTVTEGRLVQMPDGPAWRVETDEAGSAARYFLASSGDEIPDGERRHAEFLARHFLGDSESPVTAIERIERFGDDYAYVNRLLPVHRVDFAREDGMRVYVDTRQALFATLVDARKARMNWIFVTFHNWRFPQAGDRARAALAAVFLLAVLATPVLGFKVYRRRRSVTLKGVRDWHRRLGLAVSVVVVCSGASGFWHLLKGVQDRASMPEGPRRTLQTLRADTLDTRAIKSRTPLQSLVLLSHEGASWARVTGLPDAQSTATSGPHAEGHGGHAAAGANGPLMEVRYVPLQGQLGVALDDERHALTLATELSESGSPKPAAFPIMMFDGEYGFINKLLPVFRFEAGDTRLYVHTETRTLAAAIDSADYAEGWSFAQFHKWQALEPLLGRWPRDLLQIAFALAMALVSLLGLVLFWRRGPAQSRKN